MLHSLRKKVKKGWFWLRCRNILNILGISTSFLMMLHSLWQLDLISVGPVWGKNWKYLGPTGVYANEPFQCGFWFKTTVGMAYDYYLSLIVVSWFMLLLSVWFWRHK